MPKKPKKYDSFGDCLKISSVFKFLAHPQRVQLLICLRRQKGLSVLELVDKTQMSQSQVSQTLQKLKMSGMVVSERFGTSIHYQIKCEQLDQLLEAIEGIYPKLD